MKKTVKWLLGFALVVIVAISLKLTFLPVSKSKVKIGRIFVHVEQGALFSPEEFAKASHAKLVSINPRNPFIALQQIYLDNPIIVISQKPTESIFPRSLAKKFGYRYLSLSNIPMEDAIKELEIGLSKVPKYSSQIPYLTTEESHKIYDLMQRIDEVFNKNQLTYWATAGTLLGAVRHQGLIPWDDDLDICIFDFDEVKLKSMQVELEKSGLEITITGKISIKSTLKMVPLSPMLKIPAHSCPSNTPLLTSFWSPWKKIKNFRMFTFINPKNFIFSLTVSDLNILNYKTSSEYHSDR